MFRHERCSLVFFFSVDIVHLFSWVFYRVDGKGRTGNWDFERRRKKIREREKERELYIKNVERFSSSLNLSPSPDSRGRRRERTRRPDTKTHSSFCLPPPFHRRRYHVLSASSFVEQRKRWRSVTVPLPPPLYSSSLLRLSLLRRLKSELRPGRVRPRLGPPSSAASSAGASDSTTGSSATTCSSTAASWASAT